MTKDEYVADIKKWIEAATEEQVNLIWLFAKSSLKK